MEIKNMSPYFDRLTQNLVKSNKGENHLFFGDIQDALDKLEGQHGDIQVTLEYLQVAKRLEQISAAGLLNNKDVEKIYREYGFLSWGETVALPVDIELQKSMADKLYNIDTNKPETGALIRIGEQSNVIAECLFERTLKSGVPFDIIFIEPAFSGFVLAHTDEDGARALGQLVVDSRIDMTTTMYVAPNSFDNYPFEPDEILKKVKIETQKPISMRTMSGECHYTLTTYPTAMDAALDKIDYDDYLKLYFEMCDQPWGEIEKAHLILIEQFNVASRLNIYNAWGTDIEMELTQHDGSPFTFCNSLIARNLPGSEIFSAPRRDSVQGKIVSKGFFSPKESISEIIENLSLEFNNGQLTSFTAKEGAEFMDAFLARDDNNRYVGEIGIGTNPYLLRHVTNILLAEKVSRSFHIALGKSYTMTDYMGTPVHVNNGNTSRDHWDITTLLHSDANGEMQLDGKPILKNGRYIDSRLEILNSGWDAVPIDQRPKRWQREVKAFT